MYYFVERMTEDDIDQVQMIERASFSTLWSVNTYRHELRSPATSRYIVARASPTPPPPRAERPSFRRGLFAHLLSGFLANHHLTPMIFRSLATVASGSASMKGILRRSP